MARPSHPNHPQAAATPTTHFTLSASLSAALNHRTSPPANRLPRLKQLSENMKLFLLLCLGAAIVDAGCLTMPSLLKADLSTTLSIRKKADGIVVQKLCPGVDYIVSLRFPEPRSFLITATSGIWESRSGPCANHTQKTVAQTTWELPLTLGCDIKSTLFAFKLASKVDLATAFLSKNISFPLNPSCPKSRCNIPVGTSNATVTSLLTGVPLFDILSKTGVVLAMTGNQILFDATKFNKTLSPEVFLQVLSSITQFKMMGAKALLDPTMVLSLLSKFSGGVSLTNSTTQAAATTTTILFYKETSKLLSLWPSFWGVQSTSLGLATSQYVELASQFVPAPTGGMADSVAALSSVFNSFSTSSKPADSMLNVMAALGNVLSEADGFGSSAPSVSVGSFMGLLGAYSSMLSLVSR